MLTCPVFSASFKTGHRTNMSLTARLHSVLYLTIIICLIVHTKVSVYFKKKTSEIAIFTLHICEVSPAYV